MNSGDFKNLSLAGSVTNTASSAESSAPLTYGFFGGSATNLHSTVTVTSSSGAVGGLFGFISGTSSVEDISVAANLSGSGAGGIAVASGCESTLTDVSYSGTITATSDAGGISSNDACEGDGSTYNNVTTSGAINSTGNNAGGLVGSSNTTTINNSSSSMNIHGVNQVGGLIGEAYHTTISGSYATGDISADTGSVGGLLGAIVSSTISQSYATGDVSSDGNQAGGFVGYASGSTISQSFATGTVTNTEGSFSTGGFIGVLAGSSTINDSYARGNVAGDFYNGGFVGYNFESAVHRSYATGAVAGITDESGFVGFNDGGSLISSFWDTDTSNQSSSPGGTGKTTAEMHDEATYTDTASAGLSELWDFVGDPHEDTGTDDIWKIGEANDGYPCLTWNQECSPPADDGDGIPAEVENAGPNSGDANNDGTADAQQSNVASYVNPVTNNYSVLAVDQACSIIQIGSTAEPVQTANQDASYNYPAGLMNFTIACGTPGFTAHITQLHYGVEGQFIVRKFKAGTGYFTIDSATISTETIGGQTATVAQYQIVDGSSLDLNGLEDGFIEDPAGLASPVTAASSATSSNTTTLAATGQDTNLYLPVAIGAILLGGLSAVLFHHNFKKKRK